VIKSRKINALDTGLKGLIEAFHQFQKNAVVIPETLEMNIQIVDSELQVTVEYIDINGLSFSKSVRAIF
jgi:hypothetical protein